MIVSGYCVTERYDGGTDPIADNPNRLGKPLVGELEGLWSARRGDYQIIYEIFEDDQVVLIHRVQHRRDAYRPR